MPAPAARRPHSRIASGYKRPIAATYQRTSEMRSTSDRNRGEIMRAVSGSSGGKRSTAPSFSRTPARHPSIVSPTTARSSAPSRRSEPTGTTLAPPFSWSSAVNQRRNSGARTAGHPAIVRLRRRTELREGCGHTGRSRWLADRSPRSPRLGRAPRCTSITILGSGRQTAPGRGHPRG